MGLPIFFEEFMNMEQTQAIQNSDLRVLIQGYPGAFHHIAASYFFHQEELAILPADNFTSMVTQLKQPGFADVALMAIENTIYGSLMHNYKLIADEDLIIVGEIYLRVSQNLLVVPGTKLEEIREVRSHPIAIAQCRRFFNKYPGIRLVESSDTALSALEVEREGNRRIAAIGSTLAARLYNLEVLADDIETEKKNYTRFLVLKNRIARPPNAEKTSICFSTEHTRGSLLKVLGRLADHDANMTKIQSAPILGRPWEYMFFIDFVLEDPGTLDALLVDLGDVTHELKLLGSYLKGHHYDH